MVLKRHGCSRATSPLSRGARRPSRHRFRAPRLRRSPRPSKRLIRARGTSRAGSRVSLFSPPRLPVDRIYSGGFRVYTTLEQLSPGPPPGTAIVDHDPSRRASAGPSAAVVVIQNDDAQVRAMVGGYNFNESAFNLATQAERQPGSAFKAFDLAAALESGNFNVEHPGSLGALSPTSASALCRASARGRSTTTMRELHRRPHSPLSRRSAVSDNSVFARVGLSNSVGPSSDRQRRAPVRDHDDDLAQSVDGDRRAPPGASPRSTWRTPTRRSQTAAS